MSPQIRGPRTSCPAGHLFPGQDVPRQDGSPPHIFKWQQSFNMEVLVPPWRGGVQTQSPTQLRSFQSSNRTSFLRTIATLFDASAIEHFRAEDGVVYYVCGRVDLRARLSVHTLSFYVDEV